MAASDTKGFATLGVRVPGLVISPFVKPKTVFNGVLDHTSVLKFIAQKFGAGKPYSDLVDQREVGSVLDVLNLDAARSDMPVVPPLIDYLNKQPLPAGYTPGSPPPSKIGEGFKQSLEQIRTHPDNTGGKFTELLASFPP